MKRLVALMMCAVSLGAAAQSTITYPYNPDGNSDGFIGVVDLQDFLSVYNTEFVASIGGQNATHVALAYMDITSYDRCMARCYAVGGHVATITELRLFDDELFFGFGEVVFTGDSYNCGITHEEKIHVEMASYNDLDPSSTGKIPRFRRSLANGCSGDGEQFNLTAIEGVGLTHTAGCFCAGKINLETDSLSSE